MLVSAVEDNVSSLWLFPPVPVLQQTVPPGDVAVCPLSTVQYTCVADNELQWIEAVVVGYTLANKINDTAMAGLFWTVLTDISGNTLTSTATIDSASLGDGGINITCREIFNSVISEQIGTIQVEGIIVYMHLCVAKHVHCRCSTSP